MTTLSTEATDAMTAFGQAVDTVRARIREAHRRLTIVLDRFVAGLEGAYYVRAAMDPEFTEEATLDRLVREILAGTLNPEIEFLPPAERRRVAVAAIRGWTVHRVDPSTPRFVVIPTGPGLPRIEVHSISVVERPLHPSWTFETVGATS
jgi:hypothetical protein